MGEGGVGLRFWRDHGTQISPLPKSLSVHVPVLRVVTAAPLHHYFRGFF